MPRKLKNGKYCVECGSEYEIDTPKCKCDKGFVVIEGCPFCGNLPVLTRPYYNCVDLTGALCRSDRYYHISCVFNKGACPVAKVVVWARGKTLKATVRSWNKRRSWDKHG